MKTRRCSYCKTKHPAEGMLHKQLKAFCGVDCYANWAAANKDKLVKKGKQIEQRRNKAKKEALKTRGQHLKEVQAAFNRFIRLRDEKEPCISCGRFHTGQYHAGHYRTVGSCPELRFEELNCHKQCAPCNNHLSGNLIEYRKALITKIGEDKVEWLEGHHEPKNYSISEILELKKYYRAKARELERKLAA